MSIAVVLLLTVLLFAAFVVAAALDDWNRHTPKPSVSPEIVESGVAPGAYNEEAPDLYEDDFDVPDLSRLPDYPDSVLQAAYKQRRQLIEAWLRKHVRALGEPIYLERLEKTRVNPKASRKTLRRKKKHRAESEYGLGCNVFTATYGVTPKEALRHYLDELEEYAEYEEERLADKEKRERIEAEERMLESRREARRASQEQWQTRLGEQQEAWEREQERWREQEQQRESQRATQEANDRADNPYPGVSL